MKKIIFCITVLSVFILFIIVHVSAASLDEKTLEEKKEGWYPTGLPLVNYTSDDGIGYGAKVYLYYNGNRNDDGFDSTPYFMQIYAQFYATANGYQYHELNMDMPRFMGSKFRIKAAAVYNYELNANYFGIGEKEAGRGIINPAAPSGNTFSTWMDFDDFTAENKEYIKYYNYRLRKPQAYTYLYRSVTGELRIMAGAVFQYVDVESWKGRGFDGAVQAVTKFDEDRVSLRGADGGWTNFVRLGISYDKRDYEPDPNKGYYLDYCLETSSKAFGSEYSWLKNTAEAQYYISPVDDFVLALRLGYTASSGRIPFYEMNYFGFSLDRMRGLGGNETLHGFRRSRFVGRTMTVANIEGRWEFADLSAGTQRFAFQIIGLCNTGNVYDEAYGPFSKPRFNDYRTGYGGGLAITWNLATIVHFLYGISEEDRTVSIDFNYTF